MILSPHGPNCEGVDTLYITHTHSTYNFQNWILPYPHFPKVLSDVKFEIWNKKTKSFEIVQLSEEQYEEMLQGFSIVEIEQDIKDRMLDMLTRNCLKIEENAVFYKYD